MNWLVPEIMVQQAVCNELYFKKKRNCTWAWTKVSQVLCRPVFFISRKDAIIPKHASLGLEGNLLLKHLVILISMLQLFH